MVTYGLKISCLIATDLNYPILTVQQKLRECFEACIPPYGRVLGSNESKYGLRGSAGLLGPRTEQFALGSLYYLINYGFEVYGDQRLTQDLNDHGPEVVRLLQEMEFPKLDGDARLDEIIDKCWHNKYATIAELAVDTERLQDKTTHDTSTNKLDAAEDYGLSAEEFLASKQFCQDIESRGLIHLLSSAEPKEMGFTFNPTFARLN
ncbi:hypothetical protein LOZ12_006283 [Ophidiomyces ophidiicola]|uniref:Uncharacterized protein n=1 Tax=Ophidiomyces ophidiicola TaxID=1387563 RepID=A0ACB8UNH9_9EURO|nr:uncharacterized protein LOZ57_001668 [Ophidiomyces ophidiicola]KAI1910190.1 hypothetical protein LOZ61_004549 [Ophidiomyces ophidiicola]KAI1912216.1 hypothetical protein LOZ64_004521 [Ophidiomyces ophidiicola]KAI1921686.1 hypothetical protein LOZ60_006083 [Ophidiomyces ophidiicola]KAI1934522.1 hypothetical protein LOZ62_006276 [Ophidiomyces ophidiicola]KAI1948275.1 hypothetical protein LOZ59_006409 [Ophidiomyces ophidiicola]